MLNNLNDYAKYIEFMDSYEDELYVLCTKSPKKWKKIKTAFENKQYDVDPENRIFLAGMEAMEFYVKICEDEDYIASHPLLCELYQIEIDDGDEDDIT